MSCVTCEFCAHGHVYYLDIETSLQLVECDVHGKDMSLSDTCEHFECVGE